MFTLHFIARDSLSPPLEDFINEKVDEYYSLSEQARRAVSEETALHEVLLMNLPAIHPHIDTSTLKAVSQLVRSKGDATFTGTAAGIALTAAPTRGRPRVYAPERRSGKHVREFKGWLLNKLVAFALQVPLNEPPPALCIDEDTPLESLLHLQRFEAWSHITLPQMYWVIYTRDDRAALRRDEVLSAKCQELSTNEQSTLAAPFTPTWEEAGIQCIKLEEYVKLRRIPEIAEHIQRVLAFKNTPVSSETFVQELEQDLLSRFGPQDEPKQLSLSLVA